ncbi:hypothetical protein MGYG_08205 [Nannizzia gypsea CBS 118893]|uniref:Tat pathway signal sequence n=1 Tax=Arthroderma gypseum (strain ATCC MYA-4604 / CBS 118893) TaxID=535722 RepID=E4V5B7_ARTGP|nr:hypothetical protein MGYG_08205 [Nannizzia gypsea CBS 118893]EFR05191.1 hypothetical protein MGYG_08205 [Nannizzia gypsea CBS 118893]
MSNNDKSYHPLRRDSTENEHDGRLMEFKSPNSQRPVVLILSAIIAGLVFLNAVLSLYLYNQSRPSASNCDCGSYYAGLERNIPIQIYQSTEFVAENASDVAHLWEELSGDPGVVALPQKYVSEKGLPHAMRFPWDNDKGVYLLQGYHNLHCLRTLFRYTWNADRGIPQRVAFSHIQHCLDQLRQDVICNADDTPRYAGFQDPPGTGAGQVRMCKDWKKLEKWARERTACFKHEDEVPGRMIDRFKFCPDGKVLWPTDKSNR